MPRFVDRVVIHARAGNGGNGCASVHREKFKPLGGPDGGNGGRGGSIVLVVDPQVHTLLDFHFHPHVDAPSGKQGAGNNRDGAAGSDLEVKVPDGTVVLDENGRMLADLVGAGTRFEAASGGRGGLGNAALASRARKAPGFALLGENGQVRDPISDIEALEAELAAYTPTLQGDSTLGDLAERPRAVVLNKIDVPEARELAEFVREEVTRRFGWPVHEVSTVSREGLRPLTVALWDMVSAYRDSQPALVPRRPVIRPIAVDESGFTVVPDGRGGFVGGGTRPHRRIGQTDFENDEAVGYLGDRLARLGVEDELLRLGARPGR